MMTSIKMKMVLTMATQMMASIKMTKLLTMATQMMVSIKRQSCSQWPPR